MWVCSAWFLMCFDWVWPLCFSGLREWDEVGPVCDPFPVEGDSQPDPVIADFCGKCSWCHRGSDHSDRVGNSPGQCVAPFPCLLSLSKALAKTNCVLSCWISHSHSDNTLKAQRARATIKACTGIYLTALDRADWISHKHLSAYDN